MAKMKRKIFVLFLLILITFSMLSSLFISNADYLDKMGEQLENPYNGEGSKEANSATTKLLTTLVVTVKIVAVAVAIIMLLVVAMKYMTSAPGEKAEIKKSAVVYVVGAIILFAITGILTIIQKFSTAIKG